MRSALAPVALLGRAPALHGNARVGALPHGQPVLECGLGALFFAIGQLNHLLSLCSVLVERMWKPIQ